MDSFYRPTWVEISLTALRHNLHSFRRILPANIEIMAVVKANAYGHGAVEVAREVMSCGASYLAVAFLDEALELRHAGITAPILVMGYTPLQGFELALKHDITLTAYSWTILEALKATLNVARPLKIHIKLDTGMGRLGLHDEREAIAFIEHALGIPGLQVEGLFTHYACADEADKTYTLEQYARFERVVKYFAEREIRFDYLHAGNSATAIDCPELTYNMVRLGVSMYGMYPSDEVQRDKIALQPVMSFKTRIVMLKRMAKGSGISYGSIYHTRQEDEWIATLPVGYADGFSRMLTGKAQALVHGIKVPVVGAICMDQCMINVTGLKNVKVDDEVVLFGQQGESNITTDELASALGTINYEMTCMISRRVPLVYVRGGKICNITNSLRQKDYL